MRLPGLTVVSVALIVSCCCLLHVVFSASQEPGSASASVGSREKRFIPFIYPGGSVIQFALGLGLPALVQGRNLATNSGILINIDLPTNLSSLRPPPARAARSAEGHLALLAQMAHLLGLTSPEDLGCLVELDCYRNNFSMYEGLVPELLHVILASVLDHVGPRVDRNQTAHSSCHKMRSCNSPYTDLIRDLYLQYHSQI